MNSRIAIPRIAATRSGARVEVNEELPLPPAALTKLPKKQSLAREGNTPPAPSLWKKDGCPAATALLLLFISLTTTGCQTETRVTSGGHTRVVNPADQKMSLDDALGTDPCAARLRDIEAALLMYYALHKQMPPSLDALIPLADVDQPLRLTSPITGAPFGYSASGMVAPGRSKRIIVYETGPEHEGRRWCIRMPMTDPGAAQSTEVIELPEADFHHYLDNG